MVLDCLRYWASEYHIDGFRFDLAAILGRDPSGAPLPNPPLLETLAFDPILGKCKLIAEAWDAGGLYQVGSFPAYGRWAEWNGKYRDDVRKFLKGDRACRGMLNGWRFAALYAWWPGATASITSSPSRRLPCTPGAYTGNITSNGKTTLMVGMKPQLELAGRPSTDRQVMSCAASR